MIRIKRGLDLPVSGQPVQQIEAAPAVSSVALLGCDYHGLRPTMAVQVGSGSALARSCLLTRKIRGWSLPRLQPAWSAPFTAASSVYCSRW